VSADSAAQSVTGARLKAALDGPGIGDAIYKLAS
jgi:hypothetical protein